MSDVVLALSAGDPSGVGPEVIRAAVRRLPRGIRLVVFGDASLLGRRTSPKIELVAVTRLPPSDRRPGRPTRAGGRAQLAYLEAAVVHVESGRAAGLVTAPVSKRAIAVANDVPFLGHTEWLAYRAGSGAAGVAMCFVAGSLKVALATTHVPLRGVARSLTARRIVRTGELLFTYLRGLEGVRRPRILVAALNPHAGEGGLVGGEEARMIAPAVRQLRRRLGRGGDVEGPIPADAVFRIAAADPRAGVVALYHDQATIPVKLVAFGGAANVTLGLPYLRTSVDHGVAYDIAGRGIADPGGLQAAVALAARHARKARRIVWTSGTN